MSELASRVAERHLATTHSATDKTAAKAFEVLTDDLTAAAKGVLARVDAALRTQGFVPSNVYAAVEAGGKLVLGANVRDPAGRPQDEVAAAVSKVISFRVTVEPYRGPGRRPADPVWWFRAVGPALGIVELSR